MSNKSENVKSISKVIIHPEKCKACGYCILICPKKCLVKSKKLNAMGFHPAEYTGTGCIGCGMCYDTCPEPDAITIVKETVDSAHAGAAKDQRGACCCGATGDAS